jgi:hypothetical protein
MPVEKTEREVAALVSQVSSGEIRLPEIQRAYVWKPPQVAKLIESLYRGYPSGSLLFWRTPETPETRAVAANAPTAKPAVLPLYLLDGQQRLTSLHRVFDDHPDAQIVFNVGSDLFQNQSAATRQDPRWVKVHDLIRHDADLFEIQGRLLEVGLDIDSREIGRRLSRLAAISRYAYHMEILTDLPYKEVAQIFVRVNSGGRPLKLPDLALATLSARWPGVLRKLENEAEHWRSRGYGAVDVSFLTQALTGVVLGRGLSQWSHGRLASALDDELDVGWATVQRGLKHLIPLVQSNLRVSHSSLLPSVNVLLPLVVLLGERPDEFMHAAAADGILYWLLVATIRNRYSGSSATVLSQDIAAVRKDDPIRQLLSNIGVIGARVEVTEQSLTGRTVSSPYFFLSFLVAQASDARDWWFGAKISMAAEGAQKLEYHHIHPQDTLKRTYSRAEVNDLSNLAFISAKANRKISNRSPVEYFPTLGAKELTAHYVPLDESLRTAASYRDFLRARRRNLATAMTELLNRFRPTWLDGAGVGSGDDIEGCSIELTLYESAWDAGRIQVMASTPEVEWSAVVPVPALLAALDAAATGLNAEVEAGGEIVAVQVAEDDIEIPLGPLLAVGTAQDWKAVLDRERADPRPLSECPVLRPAAWAGERRRFPIASSD